MSRLVATLHNDVRLQIRNGFYYAAGFVAAFGMIGLSYVPARLQGLLFPPLVLSNLLMGTFYFVAALVLLEKEEGTLEALVVTPLRDTEYIGAKVATLALLGILENLAVVVVASRVAFNPLPLLTGIALGSAVYVLAGLLAVARYEGINEMLFPSALWVAALSLPFLQYAWESGPVLLLFWLHPLQPALVLMRAAFEPQPVWTIVAAPLCGSIWVAWLFAGCRRAYRRYLVGCQS